MARQAPATTASPQIPTRSARSGRIWSRTAWGSKRISAGRTARDRYTSATRQATRSNSPSPDCGPG